uniref:Periplasmic copper-binding protein NosD beta helix domain-containing protein n=1 Tax=Candidatus Methanophagaceae archaeon ANME-1 ERB6 TaxID=2759912 RepID=A0A7G9YRX0_9EURY|nr:hypothetical protein HAICDJOK_00014 [Methanosarcinales archaeon ANME-1 ERB6]
MKKLIKLALLILFLLSFAYPANAATIDLVRSTVGYTDLIDQSEILEFLWNTPSISNEEVRYLIKDIPSEFDVSEANVQISSNKGTFDKAIKSSKIALKSTTALTGNLEVKIKIPIPPDCPENTYTLEISEMVGSDSDMLSPSSIDITVQKSLTKPSTPILNDPGTTDTDGNYIASWSSVSGATSYTLEEDTSSSFSSPTLVHSGAGTSKYVTGKSNGTYYYRVKACNACGCSGWSNIVNIEVSIPHERGWNRTFGGTGNDVAYSVQQTSDGGYILAGYTGSYGAGSADFWLVKTDSKGNEQWNKTFGGTGYDIAYSVQQTSDDGYILAGCTKSYVAGSYDAWVVKTDSNGNMQWDKTLGGTDWDVAYSVQQTTDGGYILAGYTDSYGAGLDDALLVKIDSNGSIQWEKTFGGTGWDQAKAVRQTTDGGFIIAGLTGPNGIDLANVWLVKTDFNGNKRWEKTFGGNSWDTAESVRQTSDGGYILAGCTLSYGAGGSDFWLVKTDSSGNKQWDKTFGGTDEDYAYSVQQTTDGGFILAGCSAPHSSPILAGCTDLYGAGGSDAWLVKTDCNGKEQWNKTFGGTDDDYASSVQQTPGGGYILAGYTKSYGAGSADFWLIKTMGEPTELPVHNLNTEEDFSTIQAAIDDLGTKEGHTITVDHGTYNEHLVIDKPLKLMGEDKSTTIIEGGGSGKCVHVTANNVEISGFTIQNSTYGIWLESSDGCTINRNIIQDNCDGIYTSHRHRLSFFKALKPQCK